MKSPFFLILMFLLLGLANSCKKACYSCNQYCAYCEKRTDSTIIYKFCTSNSSISGKLRIDSIENTFPDSLFRCNILQNSQEVCDGQDKIAQSITYYEKEDYFCTPN